MPKNQEKQGNIPATPIRFIVFISRPFALSAWIAIFVVVFASVIGQSTALVFKWVIEAVQENDINKAPQYWLWSHRRWKHKKPADYKLP